MSTLSIGSGKWSLCELGASWRDTVREAFIGEMPVTWDPGYTTFAVEQLDQALSRVLTGLTGNGTTSLAESKLSATVRLTHVKTSLVEGRGDFRYRSDNLAEFLRRNPTKDLIPIVCSRTTRGYRVLDGHHRVRAYEASKRDVLALVITIRS